jgi:DNA-binding MarR family transcriptional regulator
MPASISTKAIPALAETIGAVYTVMGRGEVELNALRILFVIAPYGSRPVPQATVRDMTGLSEAAVSRNLAILGPGHTLRVKGPGLVETYEDPEYRRRKLVKLTARGRSFVESLQGIFDKHAGVK